MAPGAAVGRLPEGLAFAVLPTAGDVPAEVWALVAGCEPGVPLHGGTGSAATGPGALAGAPAQPRYAFTSAHGTAPDASALLDAGAFTSLAALLTGERAASAVLLSTLETFLACDGSWARTAEALHLHVNTVHYRMQRVEHFTCATCPG
ncbi:helix-turn-helix domain-containing protein [Streptomyces sp. NPDC048254]|uniref:helix-turn-helix domain-containing protein n=1 Tax=Streptomyces sp. NPDC048254 TaxID=3365525 RepID=UPI003716CAFD